MQKKTINIQRGDILLVSAITIFAYLIRLIHASDPIGGFHSFNEAWYSIIATNYSGVSDFIFPQTVFGRVDYNVSPFLSQLMYFWGNISGFSKGSLVFVPIIFSVLTVPVIFGLGKRLFDRNTGLVAALFYGAIPVSVIVGRNIQTDPVYVFFLCSSLLLYLKATDKALPSPSLLIPAGLLFGIAFYTKQFAALLLPAIVIWELFFRNRNLKWFGWWHIAFGGAALIFPGPFFIYHLLFNRDVVMNAQSTLSSSQYVSPSANTLMYIFSEYFWGCSPIILFLAFAGLILMLAKRNAGALLILIIGIIWNWFFLHWHGHSYYILFLMPYICLAAGAAVSAIKWKPAIATVSIAVSIFAACLSISILCTNKYGYNDIQQIVSAVNKIDAGNHRPLLIVTSELGGSYYPILRYYGRDMDIVSEDDLGRTGLKTIVFNDDRPVIIAGFGDEAIQRMPPVTYKIYRDAYGLLIYGYHLAAESASEHFFKVDKLSFFRNGPPKVTGIKKIGQYPSCFLTGVPPGAPIPFNEDGLIDFRLSNLYDRKTDGTEKSNAEKM